MMMMRFLFLLPLGGYYGWVLGGEARGWYYWYYYFAVCPEVYVG